MALNPTDIERRLLISDTSPSWTVDVRDAVCAYMETRPTYMLAQRRDGELLTVDRLARSCVISWLGPKVASTAEYADTMTASDGETVRVCWGYDAATINRRALEEIANVRARERPPVVRPARAIFARLRHPDAAMPLSDAFAAAGIEGVLSLIVTDRALLMRHAGEFRLRLRDRGLGEANRSVKQ